MVHRAALQTWWGKGLAVSLAKPLREDWSCSVAEGYTTLLLDRASIYKLPSLQFWART